MQSWCPLWSRITNISYCSDFNIMYTYLIIVFVHRVYTLLRQPLKVNDLCKWVKNVKLSIYMIYDQQKGNSQMCLQLCKIYFVFKCISIYLNGCTVGLKITFILFFRPKCHFTSKEECLHFSICTNPAAPKHLKCFVLVCNMWIVMFRS